jgi:hypothetical protein
MCPGDGSVIKLAVLALAAGLVHFVQIRRSQDLGLLEPSLVSARPISFIICAAVLIHLQTQLLEPPGLRLRRKKVPVS